MLAKMVIEYYTRGCVHYNTSQRSFDLRPCLILPLSSFLELGPVMEDC